MLSEAWFTARDKVGPSLLQLTLSVKLVVSDSLTALISVILSIKCIDRYHVAQLLNNGSKPTTSLAHSSSGWQFGGNSGRWFFWAWLGCWLVNQATGQSILIAEANLCVCLHAGRVHIWGSTRGAVGLPAADIQAQGHRHPLCPHLHPQPKRVPASWSCQGAEVDSPLSHGRATIPSRGGAGRWEIEAISRKRALGEGPD